MDQTYSKMAKTHGVWIIVNLHDQSLTDGSYGSNGSNGYCKVSMWLIRAILSATSKSCAIKRATWSPHHRYSCSTCTAPRSFTKSPHVLSRPSGVLNKAPSPVKHNKICPKDQSPNMSKKKTDQLAHANRTPIEYRFLQVGRSQFSLNGSYVQSQTELWSEWLRSQDGICGNTIRTSF